MIIEGNDCRWCVYAHISPSNKYYIGITSQKPNERWRNGKGYKGCTYFNNAIQKYGWNNFQHEIIASNLTEQEAKNFEKLLIKKLKSNDERYGYNLTEGGDGACGLVMSEESKQLLRDARSNPVCQFDLDLNFIKEYSSANLAEQCTGIWQSMILGCCHNKIGYKTAGGYVWIFKADLPNVNFDEYKKLLKHEKLPKPVCQFSLSMEFIAEYESIGHASRITGIASPDISHALSGRCQQSGGYIWILKETLDSMPFEEIKRIKAYKRPCCRAVYQFSLDMNLIQEFESRVEAGKSVGITPQAIGYACNSNTHKSHGYLWWFKDDYEKEVV